MPSVPQYSALSWSTPTYIPSKLLQHIEELQKQSLLPSRASPRPNTQPYHGPIATSAFTVCPARGGRVQGSSPAHRLQIQRSSLVGQQISKPGRCAAAKNLHGTCARNMSRWHDQLQHQHHLNSEQRKGIQDESQTMTPCLWGFKNQSPGQSNDSGRCGCSATRGHWMSGAHGSAGGQMNLHSLRYGRRPYYYS